MSATPPAGRPRRRRVAAAQEAALAQVARHLHGRIAALIAEVESLRVENQALQAEVSDATAMFARISDTLASAPRRMRRDRRSPAPSARRPRERATTEEVTPEMVGAAIARLGGKASAAEIAAEISRAGVPVSRRTVRFLAERVAAQTVDGEGGVRRDRAGDPTPSSPAEDAQPAGEQEAGRSDAAEREMPGTTTDAPSADDAGA